MSQILANLDNPALVEHYKKSVIPNSLVVATAFINQMKAQAPNHPVAAELEALYNSIYNK